MDTARRETTVFEALHRIAVATGGVADPGDLAALIASEAVHLLGADSVAIYEGDESGSSLRPLYLKDPHGRSSDPSLPLGVGLSGQAIQRREPVIVPDYASWEHAESGAVARGVRSAMAVPLLVAGRTIGAIGVRFTRAGAVEQECVRLLELLAAHMAPGLDLARQYRRAQAAHADLEAVLRLRDRVIAAASHDLRQPLGTVILRTDVLREELASGSLRAHELDASLAAIAVSAAHMGRVLDELVEAARREMGHALPLDRSPMDLVALTREILAAQQALAPETHRVRLHAFQPALIGGWDAAHVARIIQNLIGNARKYSPVGSTITVSVGREQDARGEWAVLRVRDEGIGIPTDDLPRVFEAFYRGRNAGEVPGTGLGLASAKDMVEQHGGHIAVHSTEGEGTIVTVKLPCQFSSEHPGPPRPRPLHAAAPRRTSTAPARFRPSA